MVALFPPLSPQLISTLLVIISFVLKIQTDNEVPLTAIMSIFVGTVREVIIRLHISVPGCCLLTVDCLFFLLPCKYMGVTNKEYSAVNTVQPKPQPEAQ